VGAHPQAVGWKVVVFVSTFTAFQAHAVAARSRNVLGVELWHEIGLACGHYCACLLNAGHPCRWFTAAVPQQGWVPGSVAGWDHGSRAR